MTIQPPPLNSIPYATALPPRRPGSVTTLAIIGIVLAGIGICGGLSNLFQYVGSSRPRNPLMAVLWSDPTAYAWTMISTCLNFATSAMLLAGGIGALKLRPWARGLLITYSWITIALTALGFVMWVIVMQPVMDRMGSALGGPPGINMGALMTLGAVLGFLVALALPILLLVFMNKTNVIKAFKGIPEPVAYPPYYGR